MKLWDYQLPKKWKPRTAGAVRWYLERRINYGDWKGLKPLEIKTHLNKLRIDPVKKLLLTNYFKRYGIE